jgi:hypothetical protein
MLGAFCAWSDKRLCGAVGGQVAVYSTLPDPTTNEMFIACSRGGERVYPYGDAFAPHSCNDGTQGDAALAAVTTFLDV